MSDDTTNVPAVQGIDFGGIMKLAVSKGDEASVAALEKMANLYMKLEDRNAQKEYFKALAAFQEACPEIPKKKLVEVRDKNNRNVVKYSYRFAPLPDIRKFIRPLLTDNDLSVSWGDAEILPDDFMRVSCVCRHIGGGSGSSSFTTPIRNTNPGMSDQQKTSGANTLCQRQSLINVLGLTTCDDDHDGADLAATAPVTVTESQVADLRTMLHDLGGGEDKLLAYLKIEKLEDLQVGPPFDMAVAALKAKSKAK